MITEVCSPYWVLRYLEKPFRPCWRTAKEDIWNLWRKIRFEENVWHRTLNFLEADIIEILGARIIYELYGEMFVLSSSGPDAWYFRVDNLFQDRQPKITCIRICSMFLINALCIRLIPRISCCYSNALFTIWYSSMPASNAMNKGNSIKMKRQLTGKLGGLPQIRFRGGTTKVPYWLLQFPLILFSWKLQNI